MGDQRYAEEPDTSGIDLDAVDFSDASLYHGGAVARAGIFKKLREERPVAFVAEPDIPFLPPGPGYWLLTRYDDVMHVSRNPEVFSSAQGTNTFDMPPEITEFFGSMINMDAPRHTRLRRIVNRAFTPKMVQRIEDDVRRKARHIVASVAEKGTVDLVNEVSGPLPLQIICEMMGIPAEEWDRVFHCTNIILGDESTTPDLQALLDAALEMAALAQAVGEDRMANPRDDLVSAMMHAEVDGEHLTPPEMASFFILLSAAGNETTRNAITHGVHLLTQHPDQREDLRGNFDEVAPLAVEEIVRYASPVVHFRRTATQDTRIGDVDIAEGDKVVMWYESANRDAGHFERPYRFDVRRQPNEHIGFGAGGPHFCLGANLARREIRVMFEELFRWLPDFEATSQPDYLDSSFIHGIKHLEVTFTPTSVDAAALAEV